MAKAFKFLSEQEILALAISLEEEDGRTYADFAAALEKDYAATAQIFRTMQAEESVHRGRLIEMYRQRFGEHIPVIHRGDVKGFVPRKPVWLVKNLGLDYVRRQAETMEVETRRFYLSAAQRVTDASTRKLLGDLADAEIAHIHAAEALELGADAVLVNTAIAVANDPNRMANAFKLAVQAGRTAYEIGLGSSSETASATSPLTGFLN